MDRITKAIELAREKNLKKLAAQQGASNSHLTSVETAEPKNLAKKIKGEEGALQRNGIITESLDDHFADAYRLLRTRVVQRMRQNDWKTIGITSSHPKAGKSYTAINLSVAISLDKKYRALVIDADMRRPAIKGYLGIEPDKGLAEYLSGEAELEDVTYDLGIDDFRVIPCAKSVEGSSELLGSPRMASLIEHVKNADDSQITVFDLPPILVGDDVVTLTSQLDAVLVVVEDGATHSDELMTAMELLKDVNVIGSVLNKATDIDMEKYGGYY